MRVVFGFHRQAKVEHVGDGGHVNTAGRHIGGHQNLHLAVAQRHEAAVANALAQRAMQGHGGKAGLLQVGGEAVAFNLRAAKHDGLVDGGVAQPVVEQRALVLGVVGPEQLLLDVDVLLLRAVDLDFLDVLAAVVHHAHGELLNAGGKRGREHHGLAALAGHVVDIGQVVGEAEVEHAVGFVNHQELHFVEFDLLRALQIQQAARGGHHQIGVLQACNLHLVRHAAHHVGNAQAAAMAHQVDGVLRHLLGQFAGRAQDQGAGGGGLEVACAGGVFALGALGGNFTACQGFGHGAVEVGALLGFCLGLLLQQRVQHGQQESSGLAATGLAGNHQVGKTGFAFGQHGLGHHIVLNLGGLGVTQVDTGLHQLGRQAQQFKAVGLGYHRCGVGHSVGFRSGFHGHVGHFSDKSVLRRRKFVAGVVGEIQ